MITTFFIPEAVQTAQQGELTVRKQVQRDDIPAIRTRARCWKTVMRTVCVRHEDGEESLWVFSDVPIPKGLPSR